MNFNKYIENDKIILGVLHILFKVVFQFLNNYFMHSFNKYLLRAYNMLGIILYAGDYSVNKTVNSLKLQSQFQNSISSRNIFILVNVCHSIYHI